MIDMEPPLVIFYVSETLFDTDSTNIEYYLGYQLNGPKFYSRIAREDGFILLHEEDAITVELFTTGRYFYSIYETDQGTKMQLYYDNLSYYKTKIFSLPGSIASLDMADKSEISIYAVYPNPGIGMSTIRLDHSKQNGSGKIEVLNLEGQLIKTLEYEGRGSEITLDNTDLFAGTYLCRIFSYDNFSVSERKVVIIK